ncbi:hypothetical protein C8Q76DRAFT_697527 [Earliella scabrosa]|nr:hypothetical protein C8Q76DRAFT_697527 [Earliella scabrosa]
MANEPDTLTQNEPCRSGRLAGRFKKLPRCIACRGVLNLEHEECRFQGLELSDDSRCTPENRMERTSYSSKYGCDSITTLCREELLPLLLREAAHMLIPNLMSRPREVGLRDVCGAMLLEDATPDHTCDHDTLRPTTRFHFEDLESAIKEMGADLESHSNDLTEKPTTSNAFNVVMAAAGELSPARFHAALAGGLPIRLDGMEHRLQGEWTPAALSHAVADGDISCIDCNSPNEKSTDMPASTFFSLLAKSEHDVTQPVYKVKDWPPDEHFKDVFSQHYVGYNHCFPPECADTIRLDGVRNLAAVWPNIDGAPDLGPKLYCALGNHGGREGTTRLHMDVTDAANILVWAADRSKIGAIWHLFHREDIQRLREAVWDLGLCDPQVDPIHSQSLYLHNTTLVVLARDYGVLNLQGAIKVASDFISAANLAWTSRILGEWRRARLTTRKSDVLQLHSTLWLQWLVSRAWPSAQPLWPGPGLERGDSLGRFETDDRMMSPGGRVRGPQAGSSHGHAHATLTRQSARPGGVIRTQRRSSHGSGRAHGAQHEGRKPGRRAGREQYLQHLEHNARMSIAASMNPAHHYVCPVATCGRRCNRNGLICHMYEPFGSSPKGSDTNCSPREGVHPALFKPTREQRAHLKQFISPKISDAAFWSAVSGLYLVDPATVQYSGLNFSPLTQPPHAR